MERICLLITTLIGFSLSLHSQTLPSSFKTQYLQFSMGNRTGTSETNKPEKVCNDFTFLNNNSIIGRNCISGKINLTVKLITSDPAKYQDNGSWSKRYFGYDPEMPTYAPGGTQNLSHVVTVGYDNHLNSYSLMIETPNAYKDVSLLWHYFNL